MVKSVMPKSERIKAILQEKFTEEYEDYCKEQEKFRQQEAARLEAEKRKRVEDDGEKLRKEISKYHDEKEKALAHQRDREVALWHHYQMQQELAEEEADMERAKQKSMSEYKESLKESTAPSAPPAPNVDRSAKPVSPTPSSSSSR